AHFESKARIEEYLRGLGLALNVIRPPFFMENLIKWQSIGRNEQGWAVRLALPADVPLQMVSTRDIGKVAAALIVRHEPDAGPIEIASDDVTGQRLAELVSDRVKAPAHFIQLPLQTMGDDDVIKMFTWFVEKAPAFHADFERTRQLVPDLEDLPTFLARQAQFG